MRYINPLVRLGRSKLIGNRARGLVICILALSAQPCFAGGFVNAGNAWLALPPEAKAAYVQGLNDGVNVILPTDDLATAVTKVARTQCLSDQRTTAAILADRITQAYTQDPSFKDQPPAIVYMAKMFSACRGIINRERSIFGLPGL